MGLVNRLTEKQDTGLFSVVAPVSDPLFEYRTQKEARNVFHQDLLVVHYQLFDLRTAYGNELFAQKRDEWVPDDPLDVGPADVSDAYNAEQFDDFDDENFFDEYDDELLDPGDDFDFLSLYEPYLFARDCLSELVLSATQAGVELYESVMELDAIYEGPIDELFDEQVLRYMNTGLDTYRSEQALDSVEYDLFLGMNEEVVYTDRLYAHINSLEERYLAGEGIERICSEVVAAIAQSPLLKQQAAEVAQWYFPGDFESLSTQFTLLEMATSAEDYETAGAIRKSLQNKLAPNMKLLRQNGRRGE